MIKVLDDFLTNKENKNAIACLKNILQYPFRQGEFEVTFEDEKLLYEKYFHRIMRSIFDANDESSCPDMLLLASFATEFSKADIWLECICSFLNQRTVSKTESLVAELERFFSKPCRISDFIVACIDNPEARSDFVAVFLEHRARLLCKIPVCIANSNHGDSYLTDESNFVKNVMSSFELISNTSESIFQLMGLIISCFCGIGYSEHVSDFILQHTTHKFIHIWSKSLAYINMKSMEITLSPLAKKCPTYELFYTLISEIISTPHGFDAYIKLCRRLFYIRQFQTGSTIRNIFRSFSIEVEKNDLAEKSGRLINQVDEDLGFPSLRLWSDVNSIQSASLERRIYLSQILISWFVDFRNVLRSKFHINDDHLYPDVLSGITNHLGSPRNEIRTLGMVIGEWIVELFNWSAKDRDQKLKFEYEELDFLSCIRPYFVSLEATPCITSDSQDTTTDLVSKSSCNKVDVDLVMDNENHGAAEQTVYELDSDDDADTDNNSLKPLPSTHSSSYSAKKPRYLRECLDGMLLSEIKDNEVNIACTMSAEKLIRAHPGAAQEMAVEFARALVHAGPPVAHNQEQITQARRRALVAIGVVAPRKCARYLTSEFCREDNSVGQRMSIISSLTDIACELIPYLSLSSVKGTFAHQDAGLLASLLASLGSIYACSRFSPVQYQMADELLDLIPLFYRHPEPAVRRALLIAVGTVITTTPLEILSSRPRLIFWKSLLLHHSNKSCNDNTLSGWLKSCSLSDTDTECQLLAATGLSALCERFLELSHSK
ncbi:unnamed protein product [Heterobilharzia americana]|nr:unnamed protein product [Heterobilharzia americana]